MEVVIDAVQMSSLALSVFQFQPKNTPEAVPSSPSFHSLQGISAYILFFSEDTYRIFVWLAIAAVFLWFFTISAPVVIENLLHSEEPGTISQLKGWGQLASLLSSTFYLSIVVNLLKPLQCQYSIGPNGTKLGHLVDATGRSCWQTGDNQLVMVLLAMICLEFYLITVHTLTAESGILVTQEEEELDVKYPQAYVISINSAKVLLSAAVVLVAQNPYFVLGVCLFGGIFLFLWTALYSLIFKSPACCIAYVTVLRCGSYLCISWSALVGIVEMAKRQSIPGAPTFDTGHLLIIGYIVISVICLIIILVTRHRAIKRLEQEMENSSVRKSIGDLMKLEEKCFNDGILAPSWNAKHRKIWCKKLEETRRGATMANALLDFEKNLHFLSLKAKFFRSQRWKWITQLGGKNKEGKFENVELDMQTIVNGISELTTALQVDLFLEWRRLVSPSDNKDNKQQQPPSPNLESKLKLDSDTLQIAANCLDCSYLGDLYPYSAHSQFHSHASLAISKAKAHLAEFAPMGEIGILEHKAESSSFGSPRETLIEVKETSTPKDEKLLFPLHASTLSLLTSPVTSPAFPTSMHSPPSSASPVPNEVKEQQMWDTFNDPHEQVTVFDPVAEQDPPHAPASIPLTTLPGQPTSNDSFPNEWLDPPVPLAEEVSPTDPTDSQGGVDSPF